MPTMRRACFTFFSMVAPGSFFSFSPKAMLLNTLRWGKRAYFWNTVFTGRLCGGVCVMSFPAMVITPSEAV